MDLTTIAIVGLSFMLAAFVKGATGLGFSTLALPMLALTIGIKAALPLLIVPSLASNAMIMVRTGHFREMLGRFAWLYGLVLIGVGLGLMLLSWVDGLTAGAVLGLVLFSYCALTWGRTTFALPDRLERPLAPVVGLMTGAINGLTGSQVMPLVPYLMALRLDPSRLVQATNISFSLSSLVMAFGLTQVGLMTWQTALISVIGLVPVSIGIRLGSNLRRKLSPEIFRRAVVVLLGFSGLILVVRAMLNY